jgi:hypothetical protein
MNRKKITSSSWRSSLISSKVEDDWEALLQISPNHLDV